MITAFITLVQAIAQILSLLIIIDALLSFFLSPYHPIRKTLGKLLQPLYNPIRKIIPAAGGFDFSPIVIILLVQVIEYLIIVLLNGLR